MGVKSEKLPFTVPLTEMLVGTLPLIEFHLARATVLLEGGMVG